MARPFSRPEYRSTSPNDSLLASANALAASGARLGSTGDADAMRRLAMPWQKRSFAYYDAVPEIKYAAQFYSRALSVLRLYVGERQDDGTIEETTNQEAIDQLARMQDPGGGGREALLSTYGQLRFLTGECYLVVTLDPETDREQWEILSTDEIKFEGTSYKRLRGPSMMPESYREPGADQWAPIDEKSAVVYRLWKRHPRFSSIADSTMQGVLDVCEELVLLTQAVRARARSRLAGAGLMIVNSRYIPIPPTPSPGDDVQADPFLRNLIDAMTAPITNEGSASAVVPHVVRVDVPDGKLDEVIKHLQIIDPMQTYPETGLRMELIKRLSIGLDMPPEILVGLADSNHWNAWQVDEQTWKGHLQPVANAMVADFTTSWFQPTLRAEGVADWDRLVIAYDATAVINHPDRGKDAMDAYGARAIGKAALREAKGFTDDDAPTEQELWEMLGIATRDASLALYGIPSVKGGTIEPEAGVVESINGENDSGAASAPVAGGEVAKDAPLPENVVGSGMAGLELDSFHSRILGASDVAFYRARDLAGSRLRNYARRNDAAAKVIDGVPGHKVAAALGHDLARSVGAPPARQLVTGAGELLAETLLQWGVGGPATAALGDRLEQIAAATLFDERPGGMPASYANFVRTITPGAKPA